MQSWNALQRELLPRGYTAATYISFTCQEHGKFRAGMVGLDSHFPCPTCKALCRVRYLASGITRRPLPVVEQATGMKSHIWVYQVRPKLKFANKKVKLSKFERMVHKWKLDTQESLVNSAPLRVWAKNHRRHDCVPGWLLSAWRRPVFEKDVRASRPGP